MRRVGHESSSNRSGEERSSPFGFPVVVLVEGALIVHLDAGQLGLLPEKAAKRGDVPRMQIFVESGRVWCPRTIRSVSPTGERLFGRSLAYVTYEFEDVRAFELDELRAAARAAVENDPDDIWNQVMDHEDVLRAIDAAPTFRDLVEVLKAAR
jgi:hypothetical protein